MPLRRFGTDGIRGRANTCPITPGIALRPGHASVRHFARGLHARTVIIGKDIRLSGYMIESTFVAGFTSAGMDVVTGPLPTPAVGMITRSLRANLGIMIPAFHNPCQDTGIKFFGPAHRHRAAERTHARGELARATIAATIMSNTGHERHLAGRGIGLARTRVDDRHVVEHMRGTGCNVDGKQSGHVDQRCHAP